MPVTEAMIDAAWSREQEPVAQLVTIRSDADPTPIRATDWPGGIVSNGVSYPRFPFQLAWAGALLITVTILALSIVARTDSGSKSQ